METKRGVVAGLVMGSDSVQMEEGEACSNSELRRQG